MWCDSCLLVLPLRAGAIAWNVVIAVYSLAGGLFLLRAGQYLYFVYPEWFIYGGIGMGVCAMAFIEMLALSNRSIIWTNACMFLWPFVIFISAIRAIFMIWELNPRTTSSGSAKMAVNCGAHPRKLAMAIPLASPTPFAALAGTVSLPPLSSVYWWTSGSKYTLSSSTGASRGGWTGTPSLRIRFLDSSTMHEHPLGCVAAACKARQ